MKKDKKLSNDSISTAFFLSIKRALRLRHRKSYLFYLLILSIFFVLFYLFTSLTAQETELVKSQSISSDYLDNNLQAPLVKSEKSVNHLNFADHLNSKLNPKFKHVQDQIPKSDTNQDDTAKLDGYGDRYALFKDHVISNYETGEKLRQTKPGDLGKALRIEGRKDIDWRRAKSMKSQYGMNIAASELVAMDRTVPDLRHEECKYWHYSETLPSASVVIVFHNEGLTTLMRTVHSVLLRSPKRFLKEVLLVDDYSDKKPLKHELEKYIEDNFGVYHESDLKEFNDKSGLLGETLNDRTGKVRLIRNTEREGLIRSRSRGGIQAKGEVIVFLDAHCEVNYNWLPPLLAPIEKNRKTLTVPLIDGIDSETFEYRSVYSRNDQHYKGIFEWGLYYKEIEVDMQEHSKTHKVSEPYDSPTHAGGLFAIDRKYFIDLGTYDESLLLWGGENFELSFKVWQCGGQLKWVPCSRVGHVYRAFMPYSFGTLAKKRKGPLILTNYKRVVEVWWDDEYKDFFYTREPLATFYDEGDISKQLELKNRLKCKSFDYFMNRVGNAMYKNFPKLPKNKHWGEVRSIAKPNYCLDTESSSPPHKVSLNGCHSSGGNQLFRLNEKGQLGVGERCIDVKGSAMTLIFCKLGTVDGPWQYDDNTRRIYHNKLDQCLEYSSDDGELAMNECNEDRSQKWQWKKIKPSGF